MIKLTKTNLRAQQYQLLQLRKYLPILQLKRMLFQVEINETDQREKRLKSELETAYRQVLTYSPLFSDRDSHDFFSSLKITQVKIGYSHIAGVDVPQFEGVIFEDHPYLLFNSPVWIDSAICGVQNLITIQEHIKVLQSKRTTLEKELKTVSIRVNLFEKVLIPRCLNVISKIKVFLGDQELAGIAQAKVAKRKKEQELKHDHRYS